MVALTFDDGPQPPATARILDVLAARRVPATFFVMAGHAAAHPDLIARMVRDGHAVEPHCRRHRSHHRLSRAEIDEDLTLALGTLEALGCPRPRFWRPPNGIVKDPDSYAVAAAHDLRLVTWTLQTCDWSDDHGAQRILAAIDGETRDDAVLRPDSVVLMHDVPKAVPLLSGLLDRIAARGFGAGRLTPENPAVARGGGHRFGRRDGRLPCGIDEAAAARL
jgi:peptidoglycan/xylan/chitin deacetylase (PgdA/CDA1 family)